MEWPLFGHVDVGPVKGIKFQCMEDRKVATFVAGRTDNIPGQLLGTY